VADPQPPQLPDTAPQELKDFIACKSASVTLGGTIDWLPGMPVNPDFNVTPGSTPNKATITVTIGAPPFGATYELPAEVADGSLKIDTSQLDVGGPSIDSFVNDLNAWLKFNGQCLGPAKVRDGKVTLTKQPCPPATTSTSPPQPPPPQPPVTAPPSSTPSDGKGSGCGIPFFGFLIALAALLIIGIIGAVQIGLFSAIAPVNTPLSTPTSTPASTPTATPTASAPTTPVATATSTASAGSTVAPTATSTANALVPFNLEAAQAMLDAAGWSSDLASVPAKADAAGDLYVPDSGGPATAIQDHVDLLGGLGFQTTANPEMVAWLAEFGCDQTKTISNAREWTFQMACNQTDAPPAGNYVVVVTGFASSVPQPLPDAAMCSFSVQSDVDGDLATGFSSTLPHNYLIGADLYHELLFFTDSSGAARNYILATDHSQPPRTDTGKLQGNKRTVGRVLRSYDDGTMVWLIPAGDLGDRWSAGGFCTTDRANMGPSNLAVDAFGSPGAAGFGAYYPWETMP
jgi:hypothetical protein